MQRQKAFTLTELIVALGLGTVILLVVTMSLNTATRAINRTTSQVGLHNRGYATMSRMLNELENIVPGVENDYAINSYIRYLKTDDIRVLIFLTSKSNLDANYNDSPSEVGEPPHDLVWVRYWWVGKEYDNPKSSYEKYRYLMRKEVPAFNPEEETRSNNIYKFMDDPVDYYGDFSGDLSPGDSYIDLVTNKKKYYYPYKDPITDKDPITEFAFDRNVKDFKVFFYNDIVPDEDVVHKNYSRRDYDDPWPKKITVRYKLYDPKTDSDKEFGFTANIPGN